MKYVIKGAIYNFACILLFAFIYILIRRDFTLDSTLTNKSNHPSIIDLLFLSTTVQSSVGYAIVYPMTNTSKVIMMIQQYFMIFSNLMLLYLLTL